MRRRQTYSSPAAWLICLGWLLCCTLPAFATTPEKPQVPADAKPHLIERFKALAGHWSNEGMDGNSMPNATAHYAVTAGGHAVEETLFAGTSHEMRTLYVQDGADVVLVHFCASGHHPKMRARETGNDNIVFDFDGAVNFDPATAGHMHDAVFEFIGPDELRTRWQFWEGGKPSEHVANMHFKRVATPSASPSKPAN